MRKSLVAALTGALVVGATATTFAAANPFSDVPAGHWAYDAVTRLADEGIIEGYGDGTFRGNRNITRYEMAQMVAKALSRINYTITGTERAELQRLFDTSSPNLTDLQRRALSKLNRGEDLTADEAAALRMLLYGTSAPPSTSTSTPTRYNGPSRADLDKLAAEFRDELDTLGVRVANLERNADMVKWTGKIEYTYGDLHEKVDKTTRDGYGNVFRGGTKGSSGAGHTAVFRLEPRAEVANHWTANARFDANVNFGTDTTQDVFLKRIFAEGNYSKFGIKLGRIGFCPAVEDGIVFDTVISGGELSFGSKWKIIATAGRIGGGDEPEYAGTLRSYNEDAGTYSPNYRNGGSSDDPTEAYGINFQYNVGGTGLYGGASYYYAKDDNFKTGIDRATNIKNSNGQAHIVHTPYKDGKATDKASVWAVNLGYRISDMVNLYGSYGQNTKADYEDKAWAADIRFGRYGDYAEQGDWAVWGGYAKFAQNVAIASNQGDDVQTGTKGWHVGAAYAPFKNVGVMARYSDGKYITGGDKYRKVFGRLEFFF